MKSEAALGVRDGLRCWVGFVERHVGNNKSNQLKNCHVEMTSSEQMVLREVLHA